jgi:hypothetical protein
LQDTVRCQRRSFRVISRGTREYIEAEVAESAARFDVPERSVTLREDAKFVRVASISKCTKAIATPALTFFR